MDETPKFVKQPPRKLEEFQSKQIEIFKKFIEETLGEEFTAEMKDYLEDFSIELLSKEAELKIVAWSLANFLGESIPFEAREVTLEVKMELDELFLEEIIVHTYKSAITSARINAILVELCYKNLWQTAREDVLEHLASYFIMSGEEAPAALRFIENKLTSGASRSKPTGDNKKGFGDFAAMYSDDLTKFDIKRMNHTLSAGAEKVTEFIESGIGIDQAIELILDLKDHKLPFRVNPQ